MTHKNNLTYRYVIVKFTCTCEHRTNKHSHINVVFKRLFFIQILLQHILANINLPQLNLGPGPRHCQNINVSKWTH